MKRKNKKWNFDWLIYAVGFLGLVFILPQVFEIWVRHDSAGVSGFAWGAYLVLGGIWLAYGIKNRQTSLVATYIALLVFELLVIIGAVVY